VPRAKTTPAAPPADPEVSPEQMEQGANVAGAGIEAARAEPDPAKRPAAASSAIQEAAQAQGWELSDEDCDKIGSAVVKQLEMRGAFDPPPEPVAPPPAPTGAGTLPAQPAAGPDAIDESPAPQRRSFAERFRGGS